MIVGRQFHVEEQAAGLEHAKRFGHEGMDILERQLVQEHGRENDIKGFVFEFQRRGVHLFELHRDTL